MKVTRNVICLILLAVSCREIGNVGSSNDENVQRQEHKMTRVGSSIRSALVGSKEADLQKIQSSGDLITLLQKEGYSKEVIEIWEKEFLLDQWGNSLHLSFRQGELRLWSRGPDQENDFGKDDDISLVVDLSIEGSEHFDIE